MRSTENRQPSSKDLVIYFKNLFDLNEDFNWAFQTKLANALLSKFTYSEIKYALDYYKGKGDKLTSLGFLTYKNNMKDPTSLYHAEKNSTRGDNSGDRNWARIRQNSKTNYREDYPIDLFKEPDEAD